MLAPRSDAGYGSFQTSLHPARSARARTRWRIANSIMPRMALLSGKKILVTGVLSNRSIAYGIAKAARREGAEIALTYQNERFKDRVTDMARELGSSLALPCEVTSDSEIQSLFDTLKGQWPTLDGLVHAV